MAAKIGACLELTTGDTDLCRAYSVIKLWYLHVSASAPNPSQADMDKVTKDYYTLYHQENPDPLANRWPPTFTPFILTMSSHKRQMWRQRYNAYAPTS